MFCRCFTCSRRSTFSPARARTSSTSSCFTYRCVSRKTFVQAIESTRIVFSLFFFGLDFRACIRQSSSSLFACRSAKKCTIRGKNDRMGWTSRRSASQLAGSRRMRAVDPQRRLGEEKCPPCLRILIADRQSVESHSLSHIHANAHSVGKLIFFQLMHRRKYCTFWLRSHNF